jgi:hypothetical protein
MAGIKKRISELDEASASAEKAGPLRESLSIPSDKFYAGSRSIKDVFNQNSLKDTIADRKYASDKLQNLRDEEKEDLIKREQIESSQGKRKGGSVKKMAKGGSASKRADGCCAKGKTKGRMV